MALALILSAVNAQGTSVSLSKGATGVTTLDQGTDIVPVQITGRTMEIASPISPENSPSRAPVTPLILNEGFESTTGLNIPTGWTRVGATVSGSSPVVGAWFTATSTTSFSGITRVPRTGSRMAASYALNTTGINAWMFSNAITLTQDVTYTISFWYMIPSISSGGIPIPANSFKFTIGTGAAAIDTIGTLFSTKANADAWTNVTIYFTPTATGSYFLGFNDFSPAATPYSGFTVFIDDVIIGATRTNDLTIAASYPYGQVPISHGLLPVKTTVSNIGLAAQTNVQASISVNGGTPAVSATHASLASGANVELSTPAVTTGLVLGNNTLKFEVKQTETDDDPADNTVSSTFIGTTNTFSSDKNLAIATYYGSTTAIGSYGTIFTFTKPTELNRISGYFYNATGFGAQNFNFAVYAVTGTTISNTTPLYTVQASRAATTDWVTHILPTPLTLPAGSYFICVEELATTTGIGILAEAANTEGRKLYIRDGAGTTGGTTLFYVDRGLFLRIAVDLPANDLALYGGFPYTKIPKDQVVALPFPTSLFALVENVGAATQTNVVLSATLNGTSIGSSATVPSIAIGASGYMEITPNPTAALPTTIGTYPAVYTLTQAETDANPANNTFTSILEITEKVYACDDVPAIIPSNLGVSAGGSGNMAGQVFTITATTILESVQLGFAPLASGTPGYAVRLFPITGGTDLDPTLGTQIFNITGNRPTAAGWVTVPTDALILAPGKYYLAAVQTSATGYALAYDLVPGRLDYFRSGTTFYTDDSFGAPAIRMVLDNTQNAMSVTPAALPFTILPTSQSVNTSSLSATARNLGLAPQTNVSLAVSANGTAIGSSATPVATLAQGASQAMTIAPVAAVPLVVGDNTVNYTLTSDFFTGTTVTATQNFLGSHNIYAMDNLTSSSVNSNIGNNATTGHIFTITSTVDLKSIQAEFNATTGTAQVYLQSVTGTTLSAAAGIINNAAFTRSAVGWNTYTPASPITLTPGTYYLGIAQSGATGVSLRYDATAGRTFYTKASLTGTALTAVTSTAALGMPRIRMEFDVTAVNQVKPIAFTAPVADSWDLTNNETVTVTFQNIGTQALVATDNIPLRLIVNGPGGPPQTINKTETGLTTAMFGTFSSSFTGVDLSAFGSYNLQVIVDWPAANAESLTTTITNSETKIAPNNLDVAVTGINAVFTWDHVSSFAGSYNVYLDGTFKGNVTAKTYAFNGLTPGNYTAGVEAVYITGASERVTKSFTINAFDIVSITPADNAQDVALNAPVSVTFEQNISASDLTGITISPTVSGVSASVAGAVLTIAHDDFAQNTTYTVTVPANAITGYISAITWSFKTVLPLEVVSTTPADNATNVAVNTEVSVTFNKNVTPVGTLSGITINGNAATASISGGNKLIIAHSNFDYNTLYEVIIPANTITDYAQEIKWSFTTEIKEGLPNVNGNEINIFQNNGEINVIVSEKSDIRVFDMLGKVLGNYNVDANATLKVYQPAGIYLIEVRSNGGVSTHKVVIR